MTTSILPDKGLLRPDEVANIFQVTRQTVYNWRDEGKLKFVVISGTVRITRDSIKTLLEST